MSTQQRYTGLFLLTRAMPARTRIRKFVGPTGQRFVGRLSRRAKPSQARRRITPSTHRARTYHYYRTPPSHTRFHSYHHSSKKQKTSEKYTIQAQNVQTEEKVKMEKVQHVRRGTDPDFLGDTRAAGDATYRQYLNLIVSKPNHSFNTGVYATACTVSYCWVCQLSYPESYPVTRGLPWWAAPLLSPP